MSNFIVILNRAEDSTYQLCYPADGKKAKFPSSMPLRIRYDINIFKQTSRPLQL
jgi:hypothetical protein